MDNSINHMILPFLFRIITVDEERIQFVADIITPKHDPDYIYVLSSRFHKYFLKNLDKNDINVRIMRIRDIDVRPPAASTHRPSSSLISAGYTKPPFSTLSPSGTGSTSYSHFSSPYQPKSPHFTFNHQLPVTKSPYQFETVPGIVNKEVRNPFLFLNSGERPVLNNEIHQSTGNHHRNFNVGGDVSHSSSYYFSNSHP